MGGTFAFSSEEGGSGRKVPNRTTEEKRNGDVNRKEVRETRRPLQKKCDR